MKIHNASEVLPHIDSRVHRNKYQVKINHIFYLFILNFIMKIAMFKGITTFLVVV